MDEETIDDVRDNVDAILLREALDEILSTLSEREAKVLKARYYEERTLRETGKIFGVTQERIRQIESKALRRLRHHKNREFFNKLGLPLVFITIKKWEKRANEASKKQQQEYEEYKKKLEIRWVFRKARLFEQQKFKTDHGPTTPVEKTDEPAPTNEEPYVSKPSERCPSMVFLQFHADGRPFLSTYQYWGNASIDRNRDPVTYDRWLDQRLAEYKEKTV